MEKTTPAVNKNKKGAAKRAGAHCHDKDFLPGTKGKRKFRKRRGVRSGPWRKSANRGKRKPRPTEEKRKRGTTIEREKTFIEEKGKNGHRPLSNPQNFLPVGWGEKKRNDGERK